MRYGLHEGSLSRRSDTEGTIARTGRVVNKAPAFAGRLRLMIVDLDRSLAIMRGRDGNEEDAR